MAENERCINEIKKKKYIRSFFIYLIDAEKFYSVRYIVGESKIPNLFIMSRCKVNTIGIE